MCISDLQKEVKKNLLEKSFECWAVLLSDWKMLENLIGTGVPVLVDVKKFSKQPMQGIKKNPSFHVDFKN
jgi:hypothetical protein